MQDSNTSRFAKLNESDINKLLSEKDWKSTKKKHLDFVNTNFPELSDCLTDRTGTGNDFAQTPDKAKLDKAVRQFFANVRTKEGKRFKKSTLQYIRYGLSRSFQEYMKIDINKDAEFMQSRKIFAAVVVDTKRHCFGGVEHKPPISEEDLRRLYSNTHDCFDTETRCGLQKKLRYSKFYSIGSSIVTVH